jgi:hypothetical protein
MARWLASTALAIGVAAFGVACNTGVSTPTSVVLPASVAVTSITVSGTPVTIGATSQFKATAALSDGSTRDVTSLALWQSLDTTTASVSATGVVTGVAAGSVAVAASYQNMGSSYLVTVTP